MSVQNTINTVHLAITCCSQSCPEWTFHKSSLAALIQKEDLMESLRAFAEKRPPRFKGWDHPEDRQRTTKLQSVRK